MELNSSEIPISAEVDMALWGIRFLDIQYDDLLSCSSYLDRIRSASACTLRPREPEGIESEERARGEEDVDERDGGRNG